jgi:hypothetical protein
VSRQIDLLTLFNGEVDENVFGNVIESIVSKTEPPGGEVGVPALLLLRGLLEYQNLGSVLMG